MPNRLPWLTIFAALLILAGCATLNSDFEEPTVTVGSIRLLPSADLTPRFEIGLHIVNPNRTALKLRGIACYLMLEGYKVLTGVANDLPSIDAYGQGDVTLIATTDLMNGISLFADLINTRPQTIAYELEAKLDLGLVFPPVRIRDRGTIDLSGSPP